MSASMYASAAAEASAMHGAGTNSCAYGSAGGGGAGLGGGAGGDLGSIFAMHDLAASIRQVRRGWACGQCRALNCLTGAGCAMHLSLTKMSTTGLSHHICMQTGGALRKRWSGALALPSLTLTLLYNEGAGGTSQHFAPRLVAEALDLSLRAESGEASGSGGSSDGDGGSTLSAVVRVVEVAEHLPFPATPSPASSTASVAAAWAGGWVPAEEMARVPAVLPAAHHIRWAAPTFAGRWPARMRRKAFGLGSAASRPLCCLLKCLVSAQLILATVPCSPRRLPAAR